MLLDIQEKRLDGCTVLELTGKLSMGAQSERIEILVADLAHAERARVILDMTGVTYLDSEGIGMLARAARKMHTGDGKLLVVAPPEGRTARLLALTQMNTLLPVFSTVEEARRKLGL